MATHEKVQLITPGQVRELSAALSRAIPLEMSSDVAQGWIANQGVLAGILKRELVPPTDYSVILVDWQNFYQKFFGLELNLSRVRVPENQVGFDRLIVVVKDLTPNKVYEVCDKNFKCWRYYDDLNSAVTHNDRNPTEHYAVWVRDRVEADEEFKNLSANQLQKKSIKGITLLERMTFGLKYWTETEKHLDIDNITLCSGSHYGGVGVPGVRWYGRVGEVGVGYYDPDNSCGDLRSREVVS